MNRLIDLLISNELIERILDLSKEYDNDYFVDQFDFNARVKYIKEHLITD